MKSSVALHSSASPATPDEEESRRSVPRIVSLHDALPPESRGALNELGRALLHRGAMRATFHRHPLPRLEIAQQLPIVREFGSLKHALLTDDLVCLAAPTGSGKSTVVAALLTKAGFRMYQESPRRFLTVATANRCAMHFGEQPSAFGRVGYAHGGETLDSVVNRARFNTVGLLTRRLLWNRSEGPDGDHFHFAADDKTVVAIDECHEESAEQAVLIALLRNMQDEMRRARKKPFKILLMTATPNAELLQKSLDPKMVSIGAKQSHGYPVEFCDMRGERPRLGRVVSENLREGRDVLILAASKPEVHAVCEEVGGILDITGQIADIIPVHSRSGDSDYQRALAPAVRSFRRVIVSTQFHTGVTPDVHTLITLGTRRERSSRNGHEILFERDETASEVIQDAGRLGRLMDSFRRDNPDRFIWMGNTAVDRLQQHPVPEILRVSLAPYMLLFKAAGQRFDDLPFHHDIPRSHFREDEARLELLGLSEQGRITELGRIAARFPVLPEFAKLAAIAHTREHDTPGITQAAIQIAALYEVEGILARGGDSGGRWREQCAYRSSDGQRVVEHEFDGFAQLLLYRRCRGASPAQLRNIGVSAVALAKAHSLERDLMERWRKINPPTPNGVNRRHVPLHELREELLQAYLSAFQHHTFVARGELMRGKSGSNWELPHYSLMKRGTAMMVVGMPLEVQSAEEVRRTVHLAAKVDLAWLHRNCNRRVRAHLTHIFPARRRTVNEE